MAGTSGPSEAEIRNALSAIAVPGGGDLVSKGHVGGIAVMDGEVYFAIEIDPAAEAAFEPARRAAEDAVRAVPGVSGVHATLTAHRSQAPSPQPRGRAAPRAHHHHASQGPLAGIKEVRKIVAVASGKGGVGKSTIAVNLATALAAQGLAAGLLDADIYGPSVPKMVGLADHKPRANPETKNLIPLEGHGLKLMSIGFIIPEESPAIWRGPMVQSALLQMLRDVEWGPLDVLVIDMPPGTGDAALTLAQQVPVSGAVIVSTPQDIALIDARKAAAMFEKVHVPILGIVENMSFFICPKCGERAEIFGHGGAREEARKLAVPFLGEVPLDAEIRERSDAGVPVAGHGRSDVRAMAFSAIAEKVVEGLRLADRPAPRLTIR